MSTLFQLMDWCPHWGTTILINSHNLSLRVKIRNILVMSIINIPLSTTYNPLSITNLRHRVWRLHQHYSMSHGICTWCAGTRFIVVISPVFNWSVWLIYFSLSSQVQPLRASIMGPTWGPPGADSTQVGSMWVTWTLLSGAPCETTANHSPYLMGWWPHHILGHSHNKIIVTEN